MIIRRSRSQHCKSEDIRTTPSANPIPAPSSHRPQLPWQPPVSPQSLTTPNLNSHQPQLRHWLRVSMGGHSPGQQPGAEGSCPGKGFHGPDAQDPSRWSEDHVLYQDHHRASNPGPWPSSVVYTPSGRDLSIPSLGYASCTCPLSFQFCPLPTIPILGSHHPDL